MRNNAWDREREKEREGSCEWRDKTRKNNKMCDRFTDNIALDPYYGLALYYLQYNN